MPARFVHLNVHSEYSLADSTIRIKALVKRCAALGQPSVAVIDRNNLFALVKFYRAAEAAGIKPVMGADIAIADGDAPAAALTLLCRDHDGYLSLSRLLTRAWMEGHRTDGVVVRPDWLRDCNTGLFAIAGRHGPAAKLLAGGREDLARQWYANWRQVFDDRLFPQLTRCGFDDEAAHNALALQVASDHGLPVVAGNEVRFLDAEGFDAHEARVCIASGRVLDDPRRPHLYTREQYLKSGDEMAALFADVPDAIDNTLALAQRCNLELRLGTYYLPAYPVPDDETLDSWIRVQAREGLEERLAKYPLAPGHTRESYLERLEVELDVIIKMGFPGYFLIVSDFIKWAKEHDIPVGPGRGSGAGSLVAWALKITDLDPLPYDLLFERFLNPERVSMPDFDIDFCMDRRDEVIDYVAAKYGRDRVSQIITYGTMAAKAVVRDAGRVLGYPYGMVDSVAKLVPMTLGIGLEDALGRTEKSRSDDAWRSDELIARYHDEDDVRDLLDLALQLEDLTRNAGKHAGGVVIAPSPLSDFCPLFAEHDEGGRGRNPVTQFDKDDVESIGLVKFDFLGLRTLTIIDWAVKAINRSRGQASPLDIAALPLDDPETYRLFARGDTVAVFQFESRGMRELLKRAQPDTFEDIIALAALFRPGPLGSGMDREWVDRKHGRTDVTYPHPSLEPVLSPTYGVIVYQEQVMQIAQVLAGYSLGGADLLRRAMGKKKAEEMAKERAKFEAGAAANGVDPKVATSIFDLMEKFAEYGFNKSHSAAYALVAYQTAWLKVHYPAEFMAAVLSSDMDNTDKVTGFLEEARAQGIEVLPPDVNASAYMFEATDPKTIRYGLGAVKGVGRGACEAIIEARGDGYRDLFDFCKRVDSGRLNKRTLEALVHAGALDALAGNRASLMLQLPEVLKATDQIARNRDAGIFDMFGGGGAPDIQIELPTCAEWPLQQKLAGERETLGHYLSGHPLDPYRDELRALVGHDLGQLDELWAARSDDKGGKSWRPETTAIVAGLVMAVRKRGESQAFVQIEDGRGRLECAFFAEAWFEHAQLLTRDRILLIEGGLREDEFSGGFSLRARRAWDFDLVCQQHAQRLALQLDLRVPGSLAQVEKLLAERRPGQTPLRFDLLLPAGSAGTLDLNGSQGVRIDASLPGNLRALPGVRKVRLALSRPWANG
ncbi:DNA polymerase III subunit alpha [Luteimonas sp. BDR2-5]|uniref:DNA polymerase III subunit alpha n=1 Tax=Proluteimonas luteida TaxID=2878685 RepID=UPI001E3BEAFB|nr:DNA polymerase III subunit alpha [Luteimonas sp. BDR2-5]MCD9028112.1 DNA polymerase III subunit alpha [Luteimonas sp. BDR2-5]